MVKNLLQHFLFNKLNKGKTLLLIPLLDLKSITSIFDFNYNKIYKKIYSVYDSQNSVNFWFSRSSWSLALIARWSLLVSKDKKVCVFLPDYFCEMSLTELRKTKVDLIFYNVDESLLPDLEFVKSNLSPNSFNLFLFVHYYGSVLDISATSIFCKQNNILLIEDAVHLLSPVHNIGKFSDFVMYSPYKHLPIPNGALLVVNNLGPSYLNMILPSLGVFQVEYQSILSEYGSSSYETFLWFLKRIVQKIGYRKKYFSVFENRSLVVKSSNPRISNISLKMLSNLVTRFDEVIAKRIENSKAWLDLFDSSNFNFNGGTNCNFLDNLYLYGFSFENIEEKFEFFQLNGIPVTTWPDLPQEIASNKVDYKFANFLRNGKVYFPIHQSISPNLIKSYYRLFVEKRSSKWKLIEISQDKWEFFWTRINNSNLLQSSEYVLSKVSCDNWVSFRYLIVDENDFPISIVHLLKKSIPLLGDFVRINRGPLLIDQDTKKCSNILIFGSINLIKEEAKNKKWRFVFIAPELYNNSSNVSKLKNLGFLQREISPWASGLISLGLSEENLLKQLDGKWRNTLRKGLKNELQIKCESENFNNLTHLFEKYNNLKQNKGFAGISDDFIKQLSSKKNNSWCFNLFTAFESDDNCFLDPVGLVVTIKSGDTSIYLIGTSNNIGRKLQANSVLLWSSILNAKSQGAKYFDIGGLNKDTPKGIADFKNGLNSTKYELIGEWVWLNF